MNKYINLETFIYSLIYRNSKLCYLFYSLTPLSYLNLNDLFALGLNSFQLQKKNHWNPINQIWKMNYQYTLYYWKQEPSEAYFISPNCVLQAAFSNIWVFSQATRIRNFPHLSNLWYLHYSPLWLSLKSLMLTIEKIIFVHMLPLRNCFYFILLFGRIAIYIQ